MYNDGSAYSGGFRNNMKDGIGYYITRPDNEKGNLHVSKSNWINNNEDNEKKRFAG